MTAPKLRSKRAAAFKRLYARLPEAIQREADAAYDLFRADPDHPGLNFKQIVGVYYSARVGGGYRALAARRGDFWVWFWIGTHAEYDYFLDQLRRGRQGI